MAVYMFSKERIACGAQLFWNTKTTVFSFSSPSVAAAVVAVAGDGDPPSSILSPVSADCVWGVSQVGDGVADKQSGGDMLENDSDEMDNDDWSDSADTFCCKYDSDNFRLSA